MKDLIKKHRWLGVLIAVLIALAIVQDRNLARGNPPPLGARFIDGTPFTWKALSGKPTLLYYWATWCPVCRAMQDSVSSVAGDYEVITVALQSGNDSELKAYLAKTGFPVRVIADPEGAVAERYGLRGVPALFFLDRNGTIRFTASGYTSEFGIRLRLWLVDKMT